MPWWLCSSFWEHTRPCARRTADKNPPFDVTDRGRHGTVGDWQAVLPVKRKTLAMKWMIFGDAGCSKNQPFSKDGRTVLQGCRSFAASQTIALCASLRSNTVSGTVGDHATENESLLKRSMLVNVHISNNACDASPRTALGCRRMEYRYPKSGMVGDGMWGTPYVVANGR